nr:hypothetical protein BaRGS_026061 [Batillaria attramentaria]
MTNNYTYHDYNHTYHNYKYAKNNHNYSDYYYNSYSVYNDHSCFDCNHHVCYKNYTCPNYIVDYYNHQHVNNRQGEW